MFIPVMPIFPSPETPVYPQVLATIPYFQVDGVIDADILIDASILACISKFNMVPYPAAEHGYERHQREAAILQMYAAVASAGTAQHPPLRAHHYIHVKHMAPIQGEFQNNAHTQYSLTVQPVISSVVAYYVALAVHPIISISRSS